MKTDKNILAAFILNFVFSVAEFIGGILTGSVAITSDAVHDFGDAAGIGISYFFERKSKKQPDEKYTYGYARFSVIGGIITSVILLCGSAVVIYNAVGRLIAPNEINYNGMIIFAVLGMGINFFAAYFTRGGESLNQKAVNLHMLEDVLGWFVVFVGAIIMRFTDWSFVDPIMSVGVSVFIAVNAFKNLKEAVLLILERIPMEIDIKKITEYVNEIDGVLDVHHIHIRSLDGHSNSATMHIVTDSDSHSVKEAVREKLRECGINHVTLELETENEHCHERECALEYSAPSHRHHH